MYYFKIQGGDSSGYRLWIWVHLNHILRKCIQSVHRKAIYYYFKMIYIILTEIYNVNSSLMLIMELIKYMTTFIKGGTIEII